MERALFCALLLFLLGGIAGETRDGTCLGPYGTPLPDHPLQCPGRLDGSGESSLHGAPDSPGKTRGADPPAEESSRTWALISRVAAEEVTRSSTGPKGELCHRWAHGQADPTETFQCPTRYNHPKNSFCCGTCTVPYCCSSLTDRLEQAGCRKVTEGTEDGAAGESTGPLDGKRAIIKETALVVAVTVASCFCIWISYIAFQQWRLIHDDRNARNPQPDVVGENPEQAAVDRCAPGGAASENPNPPSLVAEESPRRPQLPPPVASPPDGSGSPMVEMTRSPAFLPKGKLELPAEEDTAV